MALSGKIVFASGKSGDHDVWTLDVDSESLDQLTTGDWWNDQPRWSPDGSRIVYVSNRTGVAELWCMNEDGSKQTQLTSENKYHSSPCWMPDGKRVVCCANYENPDEVDIWAIEADGSGKRERILALPGLDTGPSISHDGNKLLLSSQKSGSYDIWEYDISRNALRQITKSPSRDYCGAYSPDGEWIAYVSQPAIGDTSDIWIVDAKLEREPVRLTKNKGTDQDVSWSPDGKYLIYCATGAHKEGRIRILNLETRLLEDFSYDRTPLEQEIGVVIKDFGIFSLLTPDFVQKIYLEFTQKPYFGMERFPHWKY